MKTYYHWQNGEGRAMLFHQQWPLSHSHERLNHTSPLVSSLRAAEQDMLKPRPFLAELHTGFLTYPINVHGTTVIYNTWLSVSFLSPHCFSLALGTKIPEEQNDIIWLIRISEHTLQYASKVHAQPVIPYFLISLYKQWTEKWENPFGRSKLQIKSLIKFWQLYLQVISI